MKLITRFLYLSAAGIMLLTSCAKEQTESYDKFENQALEAWMTQHRKELLKNYQSEGGYYVEILEGGNAQAAPVNDTACWVKFDFSGRDLSGNIVLTRRANEAYQVGTFTKYTHYVPFYRYCGTSNTSLMEGTYLAMRNTLHLDPDYAAEKGVDAEFLLREGSKIRLYMPSRIVGTGGVEGDGGYEGQFTLSAKRPFIVEMEIRDTVKNPLEAEGSSVDSFCEYMNNGGLRRFVKSDDAEKNDPIPTDPKDENHPYNIKERWVSACDTVAQLYVNYRYNPAEVEDRLSFPDAYNVGFEPYNGSDLEKKISEALVERFHPDKDDPYLGVVTLDADSVKLDGTAKIWYIGRFLDGFIFDTNIDEVKKIIYGEVRSTGSALSYKPEDDQSNYITAFYYTVPHLKFGQWAEFITTSTNGYGTSGKSGGTTTTGGYTSSYSDYLNYLNYSQMYYGNNGYYGGYYGDYYGYGGYGNGYYGGYYGNYDSYYDTGETTTTTEVYTDIPPFTPLIFQFYIEPAE